MEPTQGLQRNKIALLIDFDNVILGIDDPGFDVEIVVNALRARGIVVLGRAYGDWYRHNRHRRKLMEQGIDLIETPVFGPIIKNSADMHMALDAFELAHTQPHIDTFCIVSGDSDFLPLIKRLQGRDKNVIVIAGHKFTSELVRRNCNEYLAYENLLAASVGATEDVTTLDGAFQLLERTINTLHERSMEVRSSTVKQMMLQLNPAFSERTVGCSQFKQFLDKACTASIIKLGRRDPVSGEFSVLLPDDTDVETTRTEALQSTLSVAQPAAETRTEARESRDTRTDGRSRRRGDRRFPERRDSEALTSAPSSSEPSETIAESGEAQTDGVTRPSEPAVGRNGEFIDAGSSLGRVPLRRGRLRFTAKTGRIERATPRSNGATPNADATLGQAPPAENEATTEATANDATALDLMPEVAAEIAATDDVSATEATPDTDSVPDAEAKPTPKKRAPRTRKRKTLAEAAEAAPVEAASTETTQSAGTAADDSSSPQATVEATPEAPTAEPQSPPARSRRRRSSKSAKAQADPEAAVEGQEATNADSIAKPAKETRQTTAKAAQAVTTASDSSEADTSKANATEEGGAETAADEDNGEEPKKARRVLRRRHGSRR